MKKTLALFFVLFFSFTGMALSKEVIIDNGDPGTSNSTNWDVSKNSDHEDYTGHGPTFTYLKAHNATYTIKKRLRFRKPVSIKVYVMWRATEQRCKNAKFSVFDGNKKMWDAVLDQTKNGDKFNHLVTTEFKNSIKVIITSQGHCKTCFDALKLVIDK